MSVYIGTKKVKLFNGNKKIKKIYVGAKKIYSSGNIVTYYVDTNTIYQEEVDSEASCLSPTTFTPELSGYTFVGWREDTTASGEVLSEKIMGDEPISLYAVFKKTLSLSFESNYASGGSTAPVYGTLYYNNGNTAKPTVYLPPCGYSYSGATFQRWGLGTPGTAVTLAENTSTRAWIKYNDVSIGTLGGSYYEADFNVTYSGAKYSSISITCKIGVWSGGRRASVHIKQISPTESMLNQFICTNGQEVDNVVLTANFSENGTYSVYNVIDRDDGGGRAGVKYGILYGRTVV